MSIENIYSGMINEGIERNQLIDFDVLTFAETAGGIELTDEVGLGAYNSVKEAFEDFKRVKNYIDPSSVKFSDEVDNLVSFTFAKDMNKVFVILPSASEGEIDNNAIDREVAGHFGF